MFCSKISKKNGFTLVEVIVVVAIIGILTAVVFASLGQARKQSRDNAQQVELKQMQLALELYAEAHGSYPAVSNGGSCEVGSLSGGRRYSQSSEAGCASSYVDADETNKLTPVFIPNIPNHDDSRATGCVYEYISKNDGSAYKLIALKCVEFDTVTPTHTLSRCPESESSGVCDASHADYSDSYAVYSFGAEDW